MGRMHSLVPVLLLIVVAVPSNATSLDVRVRAEGAWRNSPTRNSTLTNPSGRILDLPEHEGVFGLRLSPLYTLGPVILRADLWGEARVSNTDADTSTLFYPEAAFDWRVSDAFVFSGGLDIYKWGPGYIANPSNPFQDEEINNLDRVVSYKRDGDEFISAEWTGEGWSVGTYALSYRSYTEIDGPNPGDVAAYALRLTKQFTSSDAALILARVGKTNFMGASYSVTATDKLELHAELGIRDRRETLLPKRVDIPTRLGTTSLHTFEREDAEDWRGQLLVGGQYTTTDLVNVIFEYLYNGAGYDQDEFDHFKLAAAASANTLESNASRGFLALANTLPGRMKRHYLFARVAKEHLVGDLDARAFLRYGAQDSGLVFGGLLRYPLGDMATLLMGAEYYGGGAGAETKLIPFDYIFTAGFAVSF